MTPDILHNCLVLCRSDLFRRGLEIKKARPDSLAFGPLGNLYFAVELYRHTGEPQLRITIDTVLEELECHCSKNRTRNYAFLDGRSGLAFLYMRLFAATEDESFLDASERIMKQYWSSCLHYGSLIDRFDLATGITGLLMCHMLLLKQRPRRWLYDSVVELGQTLLKHAILTDDGILWKGPAAVTGKNTGWAYGSAGIALALLELGTLLDDKSFHLLAHRILRCEELPQGAGGGLMTGQAGIDMVRLYADRVGAGTEWRDMDKRPSDLCNGLAGHGLAFCNSYALTLNPGYLDMAHSIGAHLVERLSSFRYDAVQEQAGLFFGVAGIGCFLLQLTEPDSTSPLFFFGVGQRPTLPAGGLYGPDENWKALNRAAVNRVILERQFKATFPLVKKRFPDRVQAFLEEELLPPAELFSRFAQKLDKEYPAGEDPSFLQRSLEKDSFVMRIRAGQGKAIVADDGVYVAKMEKVFSVPKRDFIKLRIKIAGDIELLYQEDGIDLRQAISPQQLMGLFTDFGQRSYFFRVNRFNGLEENRMGILRLYAGLFAVEGCIDTAVNSLLQVVMSQRGELLETLGRQLGARDHDDLRRLLYLQAVQDIRNGLMMGLFEVGEG